MDCEGPVKSAHAPGRRSARESTRERSRAGRAVLHRWAPLVAVGAEHAAVPGPRREQGVATRTLVERNAAIRRHRLDRRLAARRTGERCHQVSHEPWYDGATPAARRSLNAPGAWSAWSAAMSPAGPVTAVGESGHSSAGARPIACAIANAGVAAASTRRIDAGATAARRSRPRCLRRIHRPSSAPRGSSNSRNGPSRPIVLEGTDSLAPAELPKTPAIAGSERHPAGRTGGVRRRTESRAVADAAVPGDHCDGHEHAETRELEVADAIEGPGGGGSRLPL
jgi:hypothetical protein